MQTYLETILHCLVKMLTGTIKLTTGILTDNSSHDIVSYCYILLMSY